MNIARDRILSRVSAALAPLKVRAPYPNFANQAATRSLPAANTREQFVAQLHLAGGQAFDDARTLAAWLKAEDYLHGYCDPALWPALSGFFAEGFTVETNLDRKRVDAYEFGITRAAGAIAETGSIILADSSTSSRLGALAPWVHIALVSAREIFPDVSSALARLGNDPNVIWCTGPSKTADVEGILIQGVHGPGVQAALLTP